MLRLRAASSVHSERSGSIADTVSSSNSFAIGSPITPAGGREVLPEPVRPRARGLRDHGPRRRRSACGATISRAEHYEVRSRGLDSAGEQVWRTAVGYPLQRIAAVRPATPPR